MLVTGRWIFRPTRRTTDAQRRSGEHWRRRPAAAGPCGTGCLGCQMVDAIGRLTTARRAGVPGMTFRGPRSSRNVVWRSGLETSLPGSRGERVGERARIVCADLIEREASSGTDADSDANSGGRVGDLAPEPGRTTHRSHRWFLLCGSASICVICGHPRVGGGAHSTGPTAHALLMSALGSRQSAPRSPVNPPRCQARPSGASGIRQPASGRAGELLTAYGSLLTAYCSLLPAPAGRVGGSVGDLQ